MPLILLFLFYTNLKKNCTFYKPTKRAYVKTIGKINFNKNFKIEENQPSPKASFTISDANQPQIIQIKRVLKGSKIVDVRKSRESKTVFPKILKFSKAPKESADGIVKMPIIKLKTTTAFFLDILKLSIKQAVDVSIKLMPDVTAAKNRSKKNKIAQGIENGIFINI